MYAQNSIIETQKRKNGLDSITVRPSVKTRIFLVLSFLVLVAHVTLAIFSTKSFHSEVVWWQKFALFLNGSASYLNAFTLFLNIFVYIFYMLLVRSIVTFMTDKPSTVATTDKHQP